MIAEITILTISVFLLSIGYAQWKKGNHLLRHGKKANATIVSNHKDTSGTDGPVYYPVIKFITDKQELVTHQLSVGYSTASEIGSVFSILYDPEVPTSFKTNSTFQLEVLPRLLVSLGLLGLIFGMMEVFDITGIF